LVHPLLLTPLSGLRRYLVDVIRPTLERGTHIVSIAGAIVGTRNTLFVTGPVIENRLHVPGLDTKLCHLGCASTTEIVQSPWRNVQALI
jgi:hypothetical protein